jgi:hypothetical protein
MSKPSKKPAWWAHSTWTIIVRQILDMSAKKKKREEVGERER